MTHGVTVFHLLALLLPLFGTLPSFPFGPMADSDRDGTRAKDDCDDNDPRVWLEYCYDNDGDGTGDLDSPVPRQCASVARPPEDPRYHPCPES